MMYLV
jgi:hypothetical protein